MPRRIEMEATHLLLLLVIMMIKTIKVKIIVTIR